MGVEHTSQSQRAYWTKMAQAHEDSVQAVGSESMAHKRLRYGKIVRLFEGLRDFSLHDVGAGVGDLYTFIRHHVPDADTIDYSASEITATYCDIAAARFPGVRFMHRNILEERVEESYDFVVLSGVFHQNAGASHREWERYRDSLLEKAWAMARRGIAFNFLSSYADYYNPGNYYANITEVQWFVTRRLSRFFSVDHTSPLFEATVYVYRPSHVRETHPHSEFEKYMRNE